jgi:hypothetical protein
MFQNTRWFSWLRHYATNRKAAALISDGVTGNFQWLNPSGRTSDLGLTQPLTERIPGILAGGKDGRCVGLTTWNICMCKFSIKFGNLKILKSWGPVHTSNAIAMLLCFTVPYYVLLLDPFTHISYKKYSQRNFLHFEFCFTLLCIYNDKVLLCQSDK